ncbi:MAG: transposase family protein [Pseudonocardia sp.]
MEVVQLVADDSDAARCPACGSVSTSGKEWALTRPRVLPCGGELALLQWRNRRWRCRTEDCPRQSFTEQVAQVPAGMRTTAGCGRRSRSRWRTAATSWRSRPRTGCRGRRCSARWSSTALRC